MSAQISQVERQLNLLFTLLQASRPLPKDTLRFQVRGLRELSSDVAFDKCFERDLEALRAVGINIVYQDQDDFGAQASGYQLIEDKAAAAAPQVTGVQLCAIGLAASLWDDKDLARRSRTAWSKLAPRRTDEEVDPGLPQVALAGGRGLGLLLRAILERRVVSFRYWAAANLQERERRVEPWRLVVRNNSWYLIGFDLDRQEQRTYRVSRITGNPRTAGKAAAYEIPPEADDIAFGTRGQSTTATVRARRAAQQVLAARTGDNPNTAPAQQAADEGWHEYVLTGLTLGELVDLLAPFGAQVQVADPPELTAALRERFVAVANLRLPISTEPAEREN